MSVPMTVNTFARVTVLVGCAAVSGCGFMFGNDGPFRDRSEDYKKAPEVPLVTMPGGQSTEPLRDIYVIPASEKGLVPEGEFEVPRPEPLVAGAGSDTVRIQKLGDQRWALVGVAPGQVWPQVRAFMGAAGMQLAHADAPAGIMESGWVTLEQRALPSRYRFRIDQGVQRGTSELHVLQMNQGRSDRWPARSDDLEQEDEMLRAVSQFLADSADSAPVSMIADQGISAGGKIALQEGADGRAFIAVDLPYPRAWASLGRALERSSFELTDRDRTAGVYYATLVAAEDEESEGWFGWLWGDDESRLVGEHFQVSLQEASATVGDGARATIHIQPQDASLVLEKSEEQDLLALIKGNIE